MKSAQAKQGLPNYRSHQCKGQWFVNPYRWVSRVENPKSCPRCKARLDRKKAA